MVFRNVNSKNPVKKSVVSALKSLTGGSKVTNVQESSESFRANVFKGLGNHKFESLGSHVITKSQLVEMGLLPLEPLSSELSQSDSESLIIPSSDSEDSSVESSVSL